MRRAAEQQDTQAFQSYVSNLKAARAQTMQAIANTQNEFNVSYRQKIAESMGHISQKINEQYSMYIDELQQLQADMAAKDARAQEIANAYIRRLYYHQPLWTICRRGVAQREIG